MSGPGEIESTTSPHCTIHRCPQSDACDATFGGRSSTKSVGNQPIAHDVPCRRVVKPAKGSKFVLITRAVVREIEKWSTTLNE